MFVWAKIPDKFAEMGSLAFTKHLIDQAKVAALPVLALAPTEIRTFASLWWKTSSGYGKRFAASRVFWSKWRLWAGMDSELTGVCSCSGITQRKPTKNRPPLCWPFQD